MKTDKHTGHGFRMNSCFSSHATKRLRQRGITESDVALVLQVGEQVADGKLMTRRSIAATISTLKKQIQRLERLRDTLVVEQDSTIVTAYKADRKRQRRQLQMRSGNSIKQGTPNV